MQWLRANGRGVRGTLLPHLPHPLSTNLLLQTSPPVPLLGLHCTQGELRKMSGDLGFVGAVHGNPSVPCQGAQPRGITPRGTPEGSPPGEVTQRGYPWAESHLGWGA